MIQATSITKPVRPACLANDSCVEGDHFFDREIPHYESRRYNSAFFSRTRAAADSNSASRSIISSTLILTNCSTERPRAIAACSIREASSSGTWTSKLFDTPEFYQRLSS